jgi:hypothetical protein
MALEQLNKVVARPVSLGDVAKTKENFDFTQNSQTYTNKSMADEKDTVKGVLGGSVATMDTDGTYKAGAETDYIIGLFGIDAAGEPFESNRPKDSGKITLVSLGFHNIDKYETLNKAASADLNITTYASGSKLYCSGNGLLTSEDWTAGSDGQVVALVETAPASLGAKMTIKLVL